MSDLPYHEGYLAASAARITNGRIMHVQSNPYPANSPAFRAYLDGIVDCARDKAVAVSGVG